MVNSTCLINARFEIKVWNFGSILVIKCFKNDGKQKVSLTKVVLLILYSSMKKKKMEEFGQFLTQKSDIENPKLANFKS
mgnify:CR=1 FL=1